MPRTKFRKSRICSSDNYILSKEIYKSYLLEHHTKNIKVIESYTEIKCAYIKCFGKLIPITEQEAHLIQSTVTIIWK